MADELEPTPPADEGVSPEQANSGVWKHPQRDTIIGLMRRGKSADWIAYWLQDEYPDADEEPTIDEVESRRNMRWRLSTDSIENYRQKFMPEVAKGMDLVDPDLEDIIGRKLPAGLAGPAFEVELLEVAASAAQINLTRALKSDQEMNMLQSTTMDAADRLAGIAKDSVEVKQKLGMPGYEPLPEHRIVEQTNKNYNAHLHGVIDPKTGKLGPLDQRGVDTIGQLMSRPPEEARAIVQEARRQSDVEGSAEEEPDAPA